MVLVLTRVEIEQEVGSTIILVSLAKITHSLHCFLVKPLQFLHFLEIEILRVALMLINYPKSSSKEGLMKTVLR